MREQALFLVNPFYPLSNSCLSNYDHSKELPCLLSLHGVMDDSRSMFILPEIVSSIRENLQWLPATGHPASLVGNLVMLGLGRGLQVGNGVLISIVMKFPGLGSVATRPAMTFL